MRFSIAELSGLDTYKFNETALSLFRYQHEACAAYRQYCDYLGVDVGSVQHPESIPFLPVELFKTHDIRSGNYQPEYVFSSSSTGGSGMSRHAVERLDWYPQVSRACFEWFFGPVDQHVFLCLLPSYLERSGSSLIAMLEDWVKETEDNGSGFFLYNHEQLLERLLQLTSEEKKVQLWGVSFALLDFAEKFKLSPGPGKLTVVETGGMKGRREEITRSALHQTLEKAFSLPHISSEYGMTELTSQAYARREGLFSCTPWMKVFAMQTDDPFAPAPTGKTGRLCMIDLANAHSCAFLMTSDLGRVHADGRFEVLGRLDHSDLRGCNLMLA
ncbi:MAG: acyl transferase [Bacteroidetes bacterium]|nr:acyl transferase [Bacteroidota bacterium]